MKASEIRQAFLDFFEKKGHTIRPSSSLVPDDPTLLFTNAGMVQFKNVFLGMEQRPYRRAATVQKCLRVSGKHNDLESVGPSPRHHTFFEMLGNFSFGDYFKREAISYAWELLTEVYGLERERFHFTIYKDDEESFQLWQEIAGAPQERIHRMGEKTNFWMMGEGGPCGPNTELVWDRGEAFCDCKRSDCSPHLDNDCHRWLELWNLVFMQYDQTPDGRRTPLPQPGVDTGMGFERLVAVLQQAPTNYDTDLFHPIIERARQLLGESEEEVRAQIVPYRVIADHGRAMTHLIADGVLPSNEKQGYVLRMIIRRAIRFGRKLGFKEPFLEEIARVVIEEMGSAYPELRERKDFILKALSQEEERFERTYQQGMDWLEEILARKAKEGERLISGEEAFFLHDTHGFHVQIIEDIARERGFSVDRAGFEREMEKQQQRSRARVASSDTARVREGGRLAGRLTHFVGYERTECESVLVAGGNDLLVFEQTPFYAEGGGQVADTGWIENLSGSGRAEVLDVQKDERGIYLHRVRVLEGSFELGDRCQLIVDVERRKRTQRNHTATHILHAALRKVLGYSQGIQAGSLVAPDELRFDFTHFAPLTPDEIIQIERLANGVILGDLPVQVSWEKLEEAQAQGAMALFREDYQGKEKVRVVSIVSDEENGVPFSIELCGGTHVKRTGEIGLFKITAEGGVAAGVRRVYVATGENLLRYLSAKESQLRALSSKLKTSEKELVSKLEALLSEKEALERELKNFKKEWLKIKRDELLQKKERKGGCELVFAQVELSSEELKELADLLENSLERGIVLLGSGVGGRVTLVCKVNDSLTNGLRAGEIVREAAKVVGGQGGGNPRFAQGGGDQPEKLSEALESAARAIEQRLNPRGQTP